MNLNRWKFTCFRIENASQTVLFWTMTFIVFAFVARTLHSSWSWTHKLRIVHFHMIMNNLNCAAKIDARINALRSKLNCFSTYFRRLFSFYFLPSRIRAIFIFVSRANMFVHPTKRQQFSQLSTRHKHFIQRSQKRYASDRRYSRVESFHGDLFVGENEATTKTTESNGTEFTQF